MARKTPERTAVNESPLYRKDVEANVSPLTKTTYKRKIIAGNDEEPANVATVKKAVEEEVKATEKVIEKEEEKSVEKVAEKEEVKPVEEKEKKEDITE